MAYFLIVVSGSEGRLEGSAPGGLGLVSYSRSKIRGTSLPKPPGNRGQGVDYSRWPASREARPCRACVCVCVGGEQGLGSACLPWSSGYGGTPEVWMEIPPAGRRPSCSVQHPDSFSICRVGT